LAKKEMLQVGQTVWLEKTSRYGFDFRYVEEPIEMVVVEANKTTAYIWHDETSEGRKYKVNQKTHQVRYAIPDGCSYRLWLSKEAYDCNMAYEQEMSELLEQACIKINDMSLEELRTFVNS